MPAKKRRPRRRLKEVEVMSKLDLLLAIADRKPLITVEDYDQGLTFVATAEDLARVAQEIAAGDTSGKAQGGLVDPGGD